jgi:hypothetical protein
MSSILSPYFGPHTAIRPTTPCAAAMPTVRFDFEIVALSLRCMGGPGGLPDLFLMVGGFYHAHR